MDIQAELGLTAWQEVAEIAISRYFFLIAWASLYLALGYAREVREAERTASRYAQAAQDAELRSLAANEAISVDPALDYAAIGGLSREMVERLAKARPETLGQAGRIDGVTPAALTAIMVHSRRRAA